MDEQKRLYNSQFFVRWPKIFHERVLEYAKNHDISVASLIRVAVHEYMVNNPKKLTRQELLKHNLKWSFDTDQKL